MSTAFKHSTFKQYIHQRACFAIIQRPQYYVACPETKSRGS